MSRRRTEDVVFTNPAAQFDDDPDAELQNKNGPNSYVNKRTISDNDATVVENRRPPFQETTFDDPPDSRPPPRAAPRAGSRPREPGRRNDHEAREPGRKNDYEAREARARSQERRARRDGNGRTVAESGAPRVNQARPREDLGSRHEVITPDDVNRMEAEMKEKMKDGPYPCLPCNESAPLPYWLDWLLNLLFVALSCGAALASQRYSVAVAIVVIAISRVFFGWAGRVYRFWKKSPMKIPKSGKVKVAVLIVFGVLFFLVYCALLYVVASGIF